MDVVKLTNAGEQHCELETRMFSQRRIFITGDIEFPLSVEVFQKLTYLVDEDSGKPIRIYLDSYGGSIDEGLAILDMIRSCGTPIETYCISTAYSMAAVLFAAGTGGRYMHPHAQLMLHQPLVGRNTGGNVTDMRKLSESLSEAQNEINRILAESSGRTIREIEKATGYDHYFSAHEAVDFGLCDGIVGFREFKREDQ